MNILVTPMGREPLKIGPISSEPIKIIRLSQTAPVVTISGGGSMNSALIRVIVLEELVAVGDVVDGGNF